MESQITIRLFTYKWFRHYGGRVITPTPHFCKAQLIEKQRDHSYYVELLEDCAHFKKGYKIAVPENDFNL